MAIVIPVSIDENKKQISRYWKKVKSPLKAWQVDKDFQNKFKELGQGMPYTYLLYKNIVYPVGAGIISCDRLAKLNTVGTKG